MMKMIVLSGCDNSVCVCDRSLYLTRSLLLSHLNDLRMAARARECCTVITSIDNSILAFVIFCVTAFCLLFYENLN